MRILSKVLLLTSVLLTACGQPVIPFKPYVCFNPPVEQLKGSHSPFPVEFSPLEAVANEQRIGQAFAHERDFYRAITAFKRAEILLQGRNLHNILQLQYEILLSYYLAGKYEEAFCYYQQSALKEAAGRGFPAFSDLMIVVFDSSLRSNHPSAASKALSRLDNPELAHSLQLYSAIRTGHLQEAACLDQTSPAIKTLYRCYCSEAKSINKARVLNALIPGLGYAYVEQFNTALTALLVNAVFIGATYQFAKHDLVFPAIISGSLEMGWYIGGIWGAGRAAAEYNERLYERYGTKILDQERLYPILKLNYVF